jgi:RNA polymerase subunit RPABC4/transcription elongation factor Spt4
MFDQVWSFGRGIGRNLVSLDSRPIGKAALVVVLFLDLFILMSIFDGLAEHTGQLTHPSESIPHHCRDIVIKSDWNQANQLVRMGEIVTRYRESYLPREPVFEDLHPKCEAITALIDSIKNDEDIAADLQAFVRFKNQLNQSRVMLNRVKGAYDTSLLESMAKRDDNAPAVATIAQEVADVTDKMDRLVREQQMLEASLMQEQRLIDLFAIVATVTNEERNILADEVRSANFWFPVKRLGMELIFLLPLVFVFYFWNSRSITRNRPYQVLISSHLMVIVFIPVVFKIAELLYDIIPRKLLQQLFEVLESLKLVALWHYFVMALAILAALLLVYLFQKKLFSHERLVEKRIAKGLCQNCGLRLPANSAACPSCGFEQYRACKACDRPTYVFGKYCRECGSSQLKT